MHTYEPPTITDRKGLHGALNGTYSRLELDSDAEIKHGVETIEGYQAPVITAERSLEGDLKVFESQIVS